MSKLLRACIGGLSCTIILLGVGARAQQNNKGKPAAWTPEAMMKVKQVGNVQVSPDGKRVVFTVREAVTEGEQSEHLTQIHLANSDGSEPVQLTHGTKSSDTPQWSP